MDVYDVDLLQYYSRGGTFFERFAMRREEGNTLKIAWRILARDLWAKDLWAWLALGILAQWRPWDPWEDLYRDTLREIQAPSGGRGSAVGQPLGSIAPRGG